MFPGELVLFLVELFLFQELLLLCLVGLLELLRLSVFNVADSVAPLGGRDPVLDRVPAACQLMIECLGVLVIFQMREEVNAWLILRVLLVEYKEVIGVGGKLRCAETSRRGSRGHNRDRLRKHVPAVPRHCLEVDVEQRVRQM